jgi:transcriptional regulator with XRE-family HTH domain
MAFSDKLFQMRREKGFSQENLAEMLNVSRQSVSKWEAGMAMPEIDKLISIADIFGVSIDHLLREDAAPAVPASVLADRAVVEELKENKGYLRRQGPYEYVSKTRVWGLPLVHVKFSRFSRTPGIAKGIIAIGDVALGVVSIGGFALGLLSLGGISLGLLLSLGGLALGAFALGGVAIGLIAFGGAAVGVYAFGGAAIASELAVGGAAVGRVAVGSAPQGDYTLIADEASREQIVQFIMQHVPGFPESLARLLSLFGNKGLTFK